MSCLRIRLPPAKRAWKSITSKLPKLHRLKAIKKRKFQTRDLHFSPATVSSIYPFLRFDPGSRAPENLLEKTRRLLLFQPRRSYLFKKKHNTKNTKKKRKKKEVEDAVVYVDTLFKEPTVHVTNPKTSGDSSNDEVVASTSKRQTKNFETADEMWESMGLASPLMHSIDERAEEFIARIRAQMEVREKIARGL